MQHTDQSKQSTVVSKNDKADFINHVKRWVLLDTYLKQLQEKTKQLRDERQDMTNHICTYLDSHGMANKKIGIHDGDLKMYEKKEYQPLTFGYVEESLAKLIPEKESVEFIMQYLRDNREVKVAPDIRRTYRQDHGDKVNG